MRTKNLIKNLRELLESTDWPRVPDFKLLVGPGGSSADYVYQGESASLQVAFSLRRDAIVWSVRGMEKRKGNSGYIEDQKEVPSKLKELLKAAVRRRKALESRLRKIGGSDWDVEVDETSMIAAYQNIPNRVEDVVAVHVEFSDVFDVIEDVKDRGEMYIEYKMLGQEVRDEGFFRTAKDIKSKLEKAEESWMVELGRALEETLGHLTTRVEFDGNQLRISLPNYGPENPPIKTWDDIEQPKNDPVWNKAMSDVPSGPLLARPPSRMLDEVIRAYKRLALVEFRTAQAAKIRIALADAGIFLPIIIDQRFYRDSDREVEEKNAKVIEELAWMLAAFYRCPGCGSEDVEDGRCNACNRVYTTEKPPFKTFPAQELLNPLSIGKYMAMIDYDVEPEDWERDLADAY